MTSGKMDQVDGGGAGTKKCVRSRAGEAEAEQLLVLVQAAGAGLGPGSC